MPGISQQPSEDSVVCRLPAFIVLLATLAGCATTGQERWRQFNDDGVLLFARGNYRDAMESFEYALAMNPNDPVLLYNTAQAHDRLGNVQKAEQLYLYCLQRDARHGDARLAIVSLMYRTGRSVEACRLIQQWLQHDPDLADPYVADAWRLRQEKAYPLAVARVQQALAKDLNNRRALTEQAILYEIQGMPDRALVLYEQILRREPEQIDIADRLEKLRAQGVRAPMPN
ncbi:MAG: tetratricopeptide repeat protein [Planctomycetes bacterium]|nr:tetratricopeptide repeat protein [Planctomycetota bacterium]